MTNKLLAERWLKRRDSDYDGYAITSEEEFVLEFAKYLDRREKGLKDKTIRGDYVKMSGTQFALKIQEAEKRGIDKAINIIAYRGPEEKWEDIEKRLATLSKEGRNK